MLDLKLNFIDKEVVNFCCYIINKYLKSDRTVDENFIIECVEVIKDIKSLEDYVEGTSFKETGDVANYQILTKILTFNIAKMLKCMEYNKKIMNENEYKKYKYINSLITILHELEHANQRKIILEEDSLESQILNASLEIPDKLSKEIINAYNNKNFTKMNSTRKKLEKYHKIYKNFYNFAPEERLAYIKSNYLGTEIAKQHEMDYISKWLELQTNLLASEAYLETLTPTSLYLNKVNPKYNIKKIEKKDIDLSKRILYGLSLNDSELNRFLDETIEFHKALSMK